MAPLVSIIIPIYDAEVSLFKSCINSVLKQSYDNLEIILVDDGSTNGIEVICDEVAMKDNRVKVIHQKNQGVSISRNNGTLSAKGDYVLYVDSDDVLCPIAVQEGITLLLEDNTDMVIAAIQKIVSHDAFCGAKEITKKHEVINSNEKNDLMSHYLSLDCPKYQTVDGFGYFNRGPYSRLIRKEVAIQTPFPEKIPIGEDLIWNMRLLNNCRAVSVVYSIWYGYLTSPISAIRKYYGNRIDNTEAYLKILWNENKDFCIENICSFGKNVGMEFYCILRYELMSKKCEMGFKEKNKLVHEMLSRDPWRIMSIKNVWNSMSLKLRVLLFACRINVWQLLFLIMNKGE